MSINHSNGFTWYIIPNTQTAAVDGLVNGYFSNIIIPDSVIYDDVTYPIVSIAAGAFKGALISTITIGSNVKEIGEKAFAGCGYLYQVDLGDNVETIGNYAFSNCGFYSDSYFDIYLNSVKYIGEYAFKGTKLSSIIIPSNVTSIGEGAFWDCDSIKNVYVTNIESWCNISFPDDDISLPWSPNVTYHAYLNGEEVTEIIVPDCVKTLRDGIFGNFRNITSITIPESVKSIGASAFTSCDSLEKITLPFIGSGDNREWVDIPNTVLGWLFIDYDDDSFEIIDFPKNLETIIVTEPCENVYDNAFSGFTSLKSVTIPDSVTSIGEGIFSGCNNLNNITIPFIGSSVDDIENTLGLFFIDEIGSDIVPESLKSVTLSDKCTHIPDEAFKDCENITEVIIGNNVTSIGENAFENCYHLEKIYLSNSVLQIEVSAFAECTSLTDVYYNGSKKDKAKITIIENGNSDLLEATWHCKDKDGLNGYYIVNGQLKPLTASYIMTSTGLKSLTEFKLTRS